MAPFRGGSGDGGECFRDPDVESIERRREARVASEKARRLLEERRRAQDTLRAQVLYIRSINIKIYMYMCHVVTRDTSVHHLFLTLESSTSTYPRFFDTTHTSNSCISVG